MPRWRHQLQVVRFMTWKSAVIAQLETMTEESGWSCCPAWTNRYHSGPETAYAARSRCHHRTEQRRFVCWPAEASCIGVRCCNGKGSRVMGHRAGCNLAPWRMVTLRKLAVAEVTNNHNLGQIRRCCATRLSTSG
jgi:hypothetical protein